MKTVVIVDDDATGRLLTQLEVESRVQHVKVVPFDTAAAAHGWIIANNPDAVITDNTLRRGEAGIELVKDLRGSGYANPILMVTNTADPRVRTEALKAGATAYFSAGRDEYLPTLVSVLRDISEGSAGN